MPLSIAKKKHFSSSALTLFLILALSLNSCCNEKKAQSAGRDLYHQSAKVRNQAAMTLAGCGSKAKSSVPRLIELLYDENIGVQSSAAFALRKIDSPEARQALERATKK